MKCIFHDYSRYLLCANLLVRWKIIINNVPENLASVNIIQWVVQLRYAVSNAQYVCITFFCCKFLHGMSCSDEGDSVHVFLVCVFLKTVIGNYA